MKRAPKEKGKSASKGVLRKEPFTHSEKDIRHISKRLNPTPVPPLGTRFSLFRHLGTAKLLREPPAGRAVTHFKIGEPDRDDGYQGGIETDSDSCDTFVS
jgi:hypothetical protein